MKTSIFQKYLRGTVACMKILRVSKKGFLQLTSNYNYFADSWFSGVKTAEEAMAAGVGVCEPVKTSHKVFGIATLEK